ncbi:MAG TPA: ABC transporter permease [Vicinamibacterales bacterium]|nr:ABC transporter permease [Vicinamibacterales bacterium]
MRGLVSDGRFAWRMIRKTPWMSAAAVLSLAGAMAVTIGTFSVVWDGSFATLPFVNGERIVAMRDLDIRRGNSSSPRLAVFREWQAHQHSFDLIGAAYSRTREIVDGQGGVLRYRAATMTASGFPITGVGPLLGRTLSTADEAPGAEPVVVIGSRVWTTIFGSDPAVVGRSIELDGTPHRIVGVMPKGFRFPMSEDLWLPFRVDAASVGAVEPRWIRVFGRLAEGVTSPQAEAELEAIRAGYAAAHPEDEELRDRRTTVIPYVQSESGADEHWLFVGMLVFMLLVLAVACASVANLLLCRSMARQSELAVRAAIGASRGRLVAQLFIEALALTSMAAFAGVGAASIGLRWFNSYIPIENLPFWVHFGMSPAAAVFTVIAAFVAAALAGIGPAIRATGGAVLDVMKDQQRGASSVRFGMVSGALTVAEVTVAIACLAAAGLAARSLLDATGTGSRLGGDHVLVADVSLADEFDVKPDGTVVVPDGAIPSDRWSATAEALRGAVAALPGVRTAALATALPMRQHAAERIEVDGPTSGESIAGLRVLRTAVTPELFDTFGARLLAGRLITHADARESERVAVVNRAFAMRVFGGDNPVGRHIRRRDPEQPEPWATIVGIIADLPMNPANDHAPGYYLSFAQAEPGAFSLAARVDPAPTSIVAAVRRAAARVDERIDLSEFETHAAMAEEMLVSYKMMSVIFVALGGAALFLAVAGLYAVMSFSVTQRTREIGIRLALGATASGVAAVVLTRGVRQIALGLAFGSLGGWAMMRLLSLIPIGMSQAGPAILASAAGIMVLAGVSACLSPVARTLRIHPVDALRHE